MIFCTVSRRSCRCSSWQVCPIHSAAAAKAAAASTSCSSNQSNNALMRSASGFGIVVTFELNARQSLEERLHLGRKPNGLAVQVSAAGEFAGAHPAPQSDSGDADEFNHFAA